jgi:HEAT repeat protein
LQAIRVLAESESADMVVPVMTDALKDSDYYVRRDAARALRKFRDEARPAVPALLVAVKDKEPSVRRAAADALKQIDPETAKKKLKLR